MLIKPILLVKIVSLEVAKLLDKQLNSMTAITVKVLGTQG